MKCSKNWSTSGIVLKSVNVCYGNLNRVMISSIPATYEFTQTLSVFNSKIGYSIYIFLFSSENFANIKL